MRNPLLRAYDTPTLYTCLTQPVPYRQEPFKGLTKRLKGAALGVAVWLMGALCLVNTQTAMATIDANKSLKSLADKQLTF